MEAKGTRLAADAPDLSPEEARQVFIAFDACFGEHRLAEAMGWDVPVLHAVILKRLCLWSAGAQMGKLWADGHRWVALSRREAGERFGKGEKAVRLALERLVEAGWLLKEKRRWHGHGCCWYRPNERLLAVLLEGEPASAGPAEGQSGASTGPAKGQLDQSTPSLPHSCTPTLQRSGTKTGLRTTPAAAAKKAATAWEVTPFLQCEEDDDQRVNHRAGLSEEGTLAPELRKDTPPPRAPRPARFSSRAEIEAHRHKRFPIFELDLPGWCRRCDAELAVGDQVEMAPPWSEGKMLCRRCADAEWASYTSWRCGAA